MGALAYVTYIGFFSRDSARIVLIIDSLNGLYLLGADVQNELLTVPNREKCWLRAGPEFGPDQGRDFIFLWAMFGLKSVSASFREYMSKKMDEVGFKLSHYYKDVWMILDKSPDGEEYYEYVLIYADYIFAISLDLNMILNYVRRAVDAVIVTVYCIVLQEKLAGECMKRLVEVTYDYLFVHWS